MNNLTATDIFVLYSFAGWSWEKLSYSLRVKLALGEIPHFTMNFLSVN